MKFIILTITFISTICMSFSQERQATVEAEFDTSFNFLFEPTIEIHNKKILIDEDHNTIYSLSYGKETAREMLRIMDVDGFEVEYTKQPLVSSLLSEVNPDILVLHGMPNDKIVMGSGENREVIYKSPLLSEEVVDIAKYVYNGGSLFLFLSHAPNGSGALPLLEAFGVKFRDGYAYHPKHSGHDGSLCSHFIMTPNNKLINIDHPVLATRKSEVLLPDTVKFLCGAAVFRNREDVILPLPNNTINYSKTNDGSGSIEESSDSYAGMIGFDFGDGRVIIATDQGMFRSIDLLLDGEKVPVTIHDPACDNAELFLNSIRWLGQLQ